MLRRITDSIRPTGAVPGVPLGHSGRKGSISPSWDGDVQLDEGHPDGWEPVGPTADPFGGARFQRGVRHADAGEIARIVGDVPRGAERAIAAGVDWVEMQDAHGFLGASFFSPLADSTTRSGSCGP